MFQPICMGYCGNDAGVNTCAGEQLSNAEYDDWKNVEKSSHCPDICTVKSWCWTSLHQTDLTLQTDEHFRCSVLQSWRVSLCSERFAPYTKQWVLGACHLRTSDAKRWRANFTMCRGTFVRLCGCQHPTYPWGNTKDTRISKLNKRSVLTEDVSVQIWTESHFKPPRHMVWIWFAKIGFHVVYCCPDFLKSTWILPKSDLGWQSERGLIVLALLREIQLCCVCSPMETVAGRLSNRVTVT